ncbi:hypothetical protein CONPUDRAFT_75944 [Coniophora puteana RWD-64-598 SS2]|uniref:Uncharacterized protein n=1 Tax=Coniophora puteana (strain RWD-64-598) TaxID=741705 RepID=A0A5M3MDF8_CONPW|nr:uncharacterized protein CONPUDRAFT_75944 [Coniophora puteana RWD-64-598 SS2]EIW77153.1 hypothetical protein CONPUDRAFT_75944 [Coniophora puteana RWD-64-598 SS2]
MASRKNDDESNNYTNFMSLPDKFHIGFPQPSRTIDEIQSLPHNVGDAALKVFSKALERLINRELPLYYTTYSPSMERCYDCVMVQWTNSHVFFARLILIFTIQIKGICELVPATLVQPYTAGLSGWQYVPPDEGLGATSGGSLRVIQCNGGTIQAQKQQHCGALTFFPHCIYLLLTSLFTACLPLYCMCQLCMAHNIITAPIGIGINIIGKDNETVLHHKARIQNNFSFQQQGQLQHWPTLQNPALGGMGGMVNMRPPNKGGLTFNHILS